uniref:Probable potassium transport system protein Kup n=1 Tax=delta proteobacterium ML-1 TaxID=947513 RepID=U5IIN7_9DELT|nr:potassium transport system protein Kup [delta proteobacterium ML-1]
MPDTQRCTNLNQTDSTDVNALALGALGVVFGDIGTSPLYTLKVCFTGSMGIALTHANILGVLSLILWSLIVVVTIKYVGYIMLADNKGEGGIFVLLDKLTRHGKKIAGFPALFLAVLFGAAFLYGDGIITPAISVLSAVEGLRVATPLADPFVVPITCAVLLGLFLVQRRGTGSIGGVFGWVMAAWFIVIGLLGLVHIVQHPAVLAAVNPLHAAGFFVRNQIHGFIILGAVVLCVTGGEALYAAMGHFGRRPIRAAWLYLVLPCLLLNYFGQGAGLMLVPDIRSNPFYGLVPQAMLIPMVLLATMAAIIASQAMISGLFSLTRQAALLGFCPPIRIVQTCNVQTGQIYVPAVNWALMLGSIALVLVFQESNNLAAAYGLSVTATMVITSIVFFFVTRHVWGWPLWKSAGLLAFFLVFDLAFFGACLFKLAEGGWLTILIAVVCVAMMIAWRGRRTSLGRMFSGAPASLSLDAFLDELASAPVRRIPGAAVYMAASPKDAPVALVRSFRRDQTLHETVVILSMVVLDATQPPPDKLLELGGMDQGIVLLTVRHGAMERPGIPEIMAHARALGIGIRPEETTFYIGRTACPGTWVWPTPPGSREAVA